MKIDKILNFLTYPGKNPEKKQIINGAVIPKSGKPYRMLQGIYGRSDSDCNIPIMFQPENDNKKI